MQDHVHDCNNVGEAFLFLAVEGLGLQRFELFGGELLVTQIFIGFAQEPSRAYSTVVNRLADLRVNDFDHRANQWAWCVVFTTVAPGITHAFDLVFIQGRQLMALVLRLETKFVNVFQRIAQRITTLNLVFQLTKDLTDLVFDLVGRICLLLERLQIRKKIVIDELDQIITG